MSAAALRGKWKPCFGWIFLTKVPSGIAVKSVGYAAPVNFTGVSERAEGTSPGNDPQQVQTARAVCL